MKNLSRIIVIVINAFVLTAFSLSIRFLEVYGAPTSTPGPKGKVFPMQLEPKSGTTDVLLLLGLLVFLLIAVPILISYRRPRS